MNKTKLTTLYLLYLIAGQLFAKKAPCQRDKWMYSTLTDRCVRCKCQTGYEKAINEEIPYDKVLGALKCPNCTRCDSGYYSNRQTNFQCVECSTPCNVLNRLSIRPCTGRANVKCGECITGYYEWLKGAVSCTSCKDNWSLRECGTSPAISTEFSPMESTYGLLEIKNDNTETYSIPYDLKSASSREITLVILCVVLVVLAILVLSVLYCVYKACSDSRRNRNGYTFGSSSSQTTGSSGSLLKGDVPNSDLEMDTQPLEGNVPGNKERTLDYDEDEVNKLKTIVVQRDGSLLRTIATKIDRDPARVFMDLEIGDHVVFQAKKNNELQKLPIAECYLTILKKWVEKNDKKATKAILYIAFWNAEMYSVCQLISCDDKL